MGNSPIAEKGRVGNGRGEERIEEQIEVAKQLGNQGKPPARKSEEKGKGKERSRGKQERKRRKRRERKVEGLVVEGEICQAALVVVQLFEQSAKAKESTEKGEMAVVRRQAEDRQLTTRNGLVSGDNLESCPRVFTVNIFRAPESQVSVN
ncbi:uncharacterized protein BDW43DRAFT_31687 [Aspergillus alliaceus]|uniref:uncharacterized protein n=1 Tax=Petromyces alliaceus TaxID=209559 RepID=UPI0012A4DC94|nr:uncharacterized protein BDW43DRAFT_31687 [Aspergillus alliaceus]KAB8235374.1 hypothetical protein BDW43DRAFT_31687 [Aspergillus alliaceus]